MIASEDNILYQIPEIPEIESDVIMTRGVCVCQVTGQVTVHELAWLRRRLHYKLRSYFCAKAKVPPHHPSCRHTARYHN
jgi:hypothetical protein